MIALQVGFLTVSRDCQEVAGTVSRECQEVAGIVLRDCPEADLESMPLGAWELLAVGDCA